jgi:hypothetical protein
MSIRKGTRNIIYLGVNMKYERERVSMMETVIARMKNGVYDSQEDLMKAVLEVLCCTKSHEFKYRWNHSTFENDTGLLHRMKLERTSMGNIVERKDTPYKIRYRDNMTTYLLDENFNSIEQAEYYIESNLGESSLYEVEKADICSLSR